MRVIGSRMLWVDVAFWHALPLAFSLAYWIAFGAPVSAVVFHLGLALLAFTGLAGLRIVLQRLLPHQPWLRASVRLGLTLLLASWQFFLLLFYVLTLAWVHTTGRLLGWEMVRIFFQQIPDYLHALDLPVAGVAAGTGVVYLACLGGAWRHLARHDWAASLAQEKAALRANVLPMGLALAAGLAIAAILAWLPVASLEPFVVTFRPHVISPMVGVGRGARAAPPQPDESELAAIRDYQPNPSAIRRNLVVIVVDALRPDHMGAYGYHRETTPFLSHLMGSEVSRRVDGMRAVCGQSECGLKGLFSSKYVHQFSPRMANLTDVFRSHGYRIHMILSGDHSNFYGLRESYGDPDTYFDGTMAGQLGDYVNGHQFLIDRLRAVAAYDGTPTLFQFHVMATHPFGAHPSRPQPYQPAQNYSLHWRRKILDDPAAQLPSAVNFYDNAVLEADAIVRQLVEILKAKGYLEDALLVLTADHGEALGEHGTYTHAQNAHEQALRIPLIFLSFGGRPISAFDAGRHRSQVDIAPTIAAELGMPLPATWAGMPLQAAGTRRFSYFEERNDVGLIEQEPTGRLWKYWRDSASGQEYAFPIGEDPQELRNLIDVLPDETKRHWREQIANRRSAASSAGAPGASPRRASQGA